jgi:FkbM family methyltransferase
MATVQFRGKGRLTIWMGGVASRFTPDADCYPVAGARVSVSLNDRIGRWMWAGCYELELVTLLRQVLDVGMTFVDVGAQIGYFSIIAAALVGERGMVHSFEPDPDNFSRLAANARTYPWVTAHNSAVGDRIGEIAFYRSPIKSESGWGALFNEDGQRERVSAQICTLDSWASAAGIERIDLLKMDVEGAEYRVLEGAQAVIARTRPVMWVEANEVCLARDGKSVAMLLQRLTGWDYVTQGVWDKRTRSLENIVAIPKERADLIEKLGRAKLGLRPAPAAGSVDAKHVAAVR